MAKVKKKEFKEVIASLSTIKSLELLTLTNGNVLFLEADKFVKKNDFNITNTGKDTNDRAKYLNTITAGIGFSADRVDIMHVNFAGAVMVNLEEYFEIYAIPCPEILKDKEAYIIKGENVISFSPTEPKMMNLNENK